MLKATKKSRRNQKLTLGRTRISRRARYVRREFFARQMELEFLKSSKAPAAEIAAAQRRFDSIQQSFNQLPKLARKLEVSERAAAAELEDSDEEGEE